MGLLRWEISANRKRKAFFLGLAVPIWITFMYLFWPDPKVTGVLVYVNENTFYMEEETKSSILTRYPNPMMRFWELKYSNKTVDLPAHLKVFQTTLNLTEQEIMRKVFLRTTELFKEYKVRYHLQSGSLLGAHRHHGVIPWDDDFDVHVNVADNATIARAFAENKPVMADNLELLYFPNENNFSKVKIEYVWTNSTHRVPQGRWPFIDIFFYSISGESMVDKSLYGHGRMKFDKIFPLKYMFFEGDYHPAPSNIRHATKNFYNTSLDTCCASHKHFKGSGLKPKCVPCKQLYPYFPFVIRFENGTEKLMLNGTELV